MSFQRMYQTAVQCCEMSIRKRATRGCLCGCRYRECLIVGGELRQNETRILLKVMEYTHPPDSSLLVECPLKD